ncbi:hypothetical protein CMV_026748 [Castanea mollissima]|uniref:PGG domain-containing protein n=1 Tax=Castanea mollissima TaxID=60419 RepID=A0A8J4V791_9ROSI|nr:hypothetical protein CMV_026748 [Castanea mollissima]
MEEGRQYRMDPEVFRAASTGNLSFFEKASNSKLLEVTPEKNTVLHVALQFNQFAVAEKIVSLCPSLVSKKNSKDNTPLHVASRAGTSSIVKLLIDKAKKEDVEASGSQQELLSMVNQDRDTALHVAVRYCNFEVVKELINKKDPADLVNKAGESALFLAVERRHYDIASHILKKAQTCSYAGRDDMNVLHALAFCTSDWPEVIFGRASLITKSLNTLTKSPDSNYIPEGFMKKVMRKWPSAIEKPNTSGWTPLHIAAFMGNKKFVKLLLEVALEMDPPKSNIAYSKDEEGSSALHIAAREGNVKVMKELINKCPDMYEMLDNMGRNALHVAAESGKSAAITFFLERPEYKMSTLLINEQDTKGNTPMHLAADEGHFEIASQLGREDDVDLNSTNNDGFTTMDNVLLQDKLSFLLTRELRVKLKGAQPSLRGVLFLKEMSDPEVPADKSISDSKAEKDNSDTKAESTMDSVAEADGKKNSNSKADISTKMAKNSNSKEDIMKMAKNSNSKEDIMKMAKIIMSNPKADRFRMMVEVNMLVATLITTVTFTAAFTVPGGYRSQGVDEGKAVLSKTNAFRVFQMANTLAFGLSTTSVFYNYAAMTSYFLQPIDYEQRALFFTTYSILLLLVAFVAGTYMVVPHTMGMTTAVVVCCCFFSNQILSLPYFLVHTCADLTQSFVREEKQEIDEESSPGGSKAPPVRG